MKAGMIKIQSLAPWDIAFYDLVSNNIYVNKNYIKSELVLKLILKHELIHFIHFNEDKTLLKLGAFWKSLKYHHEFYGSSDEKMLKFLLSLSLNTLNIRERMKILLYKLLFPFQFIHKMDDRWVIDCTWFNIKLW